MHGKGEADIRRRGGKYDGMELCDTRNLCARQNQTGSRKWRKGDGYRHGKDGQRRIRRRQIGTGDAVPGDRDTGSGNRVDKDQNESGAVHEKTYLVRLLTCWYMSSAALTTLEFAS